MMQQQNELIDKAIQDLKNELDENAKNYKKECENFLKILQQDRLFIQTTSKKVEADLERAKHMFEETQPFGFSSDRK